jgi:pSer/pThr/pTyr-binding forkhead associated (FHA) protein
VEAYTTVFVDGVGLGGTLGVWLVNARVDVEVELPIGALVLLVLLALLTF